MYPIFISTFVTLTTLLLDIRGKCLKPAYKYVVIFFSLAGIGFFLKSTQVQADEFDLFRQKYFTIDPLSNEVTITTVEDETKKKKKSEREVIKEFMFSCKKKMDYHFEEGRKRLKEAEEASLLLPNISEQDKTYFFLANTLKTAAPGTPTLNLISRALAICTQYASMAMPEWQRVETKLHQAKYHFEMEEHYQFIGKYVQDRLNAKTL